MERCGLVIVGWMSCLVEFVFSRSMCQTLCVQHVAHLIAGYTKARSDAKGVQIQADLATWLERVVRPYEKAER